MPNHWLEFQPMCFKIFFITKQNKVKESNKTPSNFIWLFLRRKENWNDSPNSLVTAQCYFTHLLVELPSPGSWGLWGLHFWVASHISLIISKLQQSVENMHIVNSCQICRACRSDNWKFSTLSLSPCLCKHQKVAQGRKSIFKRKESTTNMFLYRQKSKMSNLGQKGTLSSQPESSALAIVGECERCLKLTYASFPSASWHQVVST